MPDLNRIRSAVEARSDELVALLASFIEVATENPPGTRLEEARSWIGGASLEVRHRPKAVMHAPDEHVPISNLIEACAVYAAVLGDTLGYRSS